MPTKHPIQPIEADDQGVMRFKENKIISDAVIDNRIDLNKLYLSDYSAEDRAQLSMLIGYSVSGFGELSHVPRDLRNMIDAHALYPTDDNTPVELTLQDRVAHLERELARLRKLVAETAVEALVVTSENEEDIRTAVANLAADALDVHPSHIDERVAEAREARGLNKCRDCDTQDNTVKEYGSLASVNGQQVMMSLCPDCAETQMEKEAAGENLTLTVIS